MDSGYEAVQLEPFLHQVGGHSSVLCFDEHTLCKPLVSREHHFYKTMPDAMKEFTPEYRGVVEVTFQESQDGVLQLMAFPLSENGCRKVLPNIKTKPNDTNTVHSHQEPENCSMGDTDRNHEEVNGHVKSESEEAFEFVDPLSESEEAGMLAQNPWSLQCHLKHIDKMKKMASEGCTQKFILLENLASHLKYPCILDLKMGTRQHGDWATEEKKKLQIDRCQNSTSRTLGTRICGMQVYHPSSSSFVYHDKYYGRQLTDEGFHRTLHQFLHDGQRLRAELLEPIISRLNQLHNTLSNQETFRFYSSSLLVMYEGAPAAAFPQVDNERPPRAAATPPQTASSTSPSSSVSTQEYSSTPHSQIPPPGPNPAPPAPHVDIRMIDFAHTTHKGLFSNDILHEGPDRGYLFGLRTLIGAFNKLKLSVSSDAASS